MTEDNEKEFFKTRTINIEIVSENEIKVSKQTGAINDTTNVYRNGGKGYSIKIPNLCESKPGPSYFTFDDLKGYGDGPQSFKYREKLPPNVSKADSTRVSDRNN